MAASNWAESISQILDEEASGNSNILSKVKTEKRKSTLSLGFEIDQEKVPEAKKSTPKAKDTTTEDATVSKERRLNKKRKFELLKTLRVKPDVRDRNREITLKKVATKGVVQLFNAVQKQQLSLKKQVSAEKIDSKREDILNNINKKNFLNVLMGGAKSVLIDNPVKKEKRESDDDEEEDDSTNSKPTAAKRPAKESTWNVLKDNFISNSTKGSAWDEDSEEDPGEEND